MKMWSACLLILACSQASAQPGLLTVSGFGTVDASAFASSAQARIMAERAAEVDGQRRLAESIKGVEISGGTTVEEYEVTSDLIATRVRALVRGAFVLDKKTIEDNGSIVAEVKMAICLDSRPEPCKNRASLDTIVANDN
jgi:hypothetical protein